MNSNYSTINVLDQFPMFRPNSAGSYEAKALLTLQTINQVFPLLSTLANGVGCRRLPIYRVDSFPANERDRVAANDLKSLLDRHGSDKALVHDYHHLYGPLLSNREQVRSVFEIGLGTNNTDVVSSMGVHGTPGASLRAFRDFLQNANIYGADIDPRILFSEERIQTFHVDQTDTNSMATLEALWPGDLDLVIDDGLHSPNANLATLAFALPRLRRGGWVVIEDIAAAAIPFWEVVSSLLPGHFQTNLFAATGGMLFAVKRLV